MNLNAPSGGTRAWRENAADVARRIKEARATKSLRAPFSPDLRAACLGVREQAADQGVPPEHVAKAIGVSHSLLKGWAVRAEEAKGLDVVQSEAQELLAKLRNRLMQEQKHLAQESTRLAAQIEHIESTMAMLRAERVGGAE